MKLGYFYTIGTFHSVTSKAELNKWKINCQADKYNFGVRDCCIYPSFHAITPTKDNICKTCFQENKEEIVFLLTKIKLGI